MITLTEEVPEESTQVITMAFTDAAGDAVTPDTITWSLSLMDGTAVNSRTNIVIAAPAASVSVTLSGDDHALVADATNQRIFTVKATYTSTEGAGLPLNEEATFSIEPLVNVP